MRVRKRHGLPGHTGEGRRPPESPAWFSIARVVCQVSGTTNHRRESMKRRVAMTCVALALLLGARPGRAGDQPPKEPDKPAENKPAILSAKPLKIDPKDDPLRKLLKER